MSSLVLKVKTKTGQQVIKSLTSESTVNDLKVELSNWSNIPVGRLHILTGYPPKLFDVPEGSAKLGDCNVSSGDTFILEEKPQFASNEQLEKRPLASNEQVASATPVVPSREKNVESRTHVTDNEAFPGILMKHVVPADNSCLFSSIYFVLNGKIDETGSISPLMRQLIAETVSKDPENYSEAILGKPNADYCKWIQDDKSWGGAIELAVLSNHYGIEIAVVDTINAIINRFGEDQQYPHRVLLLFDGIHYDPLYLEPLEVRHNYIYIYVTSFHN